MNVRQVALSAVAALAVAGAAAGEVVAQPAPTVSPAPAPTLRPAPVPTATASPTPAPRGRRGAPSPSPSPSETPPPPQFSTLDGVWEVEVQPLNSTTTVYSHFFLTQKGEELSGTWQRSNKQKLPFTGTFDGRLFSITAKDGATTYTLSGYAENFSDMVGLMRSSDPKDQGTPFTAEHRKKERLGA